jgi:hypothetical protein
VVRFPDICCIKSTSLNPDANFAKAAPRRFHKTFGKSGHLRSQRSSMMCASRFGQSPFSCSLHFIMLPLRPYFSMSLRTL